MLLTQHEVGNHRKETKRKQSGSQQVTSHLRDEVGGDSIVSTDVFMATIVCNDKVGRGRGRRRGGGTVTWEMKGIWNSDITYMNRAFCWTNRSIAERLPNTWFMIMKKIAPTLLIKYSSTNILLEAHER